MPLMPVSELPPPLVGNQRNIERIADWHHPFHPREELIHAGVGALALRNSRKQWVFYDHHHNTFPGYHAIYKGPLLPDNEHDQFRTVIFAAAGYVPRWAISFQHSAAGSIRPLSEMQREQLWESGQVRIDNEVLVRDFLISYLVSRDFVDPESSLVNEFLGTKNPKRRYHLGNTLLRAAAYEAVMPINPLYRKAKKTELLPASVAHSAGKFVLASMASVNTRRRAQQALRSRLWPEYC